MLLGRRYGGNTAAASFLAPVSFSLFLLMCVLLSLLIIPSADAQQQQTTCGPGYKPAPDDASKCRLSLTFLMPGMRASHSQVNLVLALAMTHVNERNGVVVGEETANSVNRVMFQPTMALNTNYDVAGAIAQFNANIPTSGILGEVKSSNSIPVAYHAAGRGIPQMSYISTSPTLSSSSTFPFFMRTVPGDDLAVYAGAALLDSYKWHNVAMVYVNDGYGFGYLNGLRGFETEFNVVIHVAVGLEDGSSDDDMRNALLEIKQRNLYIIYIALFNDQYRLFEIAEELGMLGKGYQYILSDSGGDPGSYYKTEEEVQAAYRRYDGVLQVKANGMAEPEQVTKLYEEYRKFAADIFDNTPRVAGFRDQFVPLLDNLDRDTETTDKMSLSNSNGFAYDMVWMLALGMQKALETYPDEFSQRAYGLDWARNVTSFLTSEESRIELPIGVSGKPVRLATNGDRDESTVAIKVYNWRDGVLPVALGVTKKSDGTPDITASSTSPVRFAGNMPEPPLDGWSCPYGNTYSISQGCVPCPVGQFLNGTTKGCQPCRRGSFSSHEGATSCTDCQELSDATVRYQDEEGQTSCKPCPSFTVRPGNQPGKSVHECLCKEGYYQPEDKLNGALCVPCPYGGVCPGANQEALNNTRSYPKKGYWGDPLYQQLFIVCPLEDTSCKGGNEFKCAKGYEGRLCALCSKGYYKVAGTCAKCADNQGWLATMVSVSTFLIFFVWFAVNKLTAGRYDAADIFLHFMQLSDIIGNFNLSFDSNIETWKVASGFVNFDVDILTMWECYMRWNYLGSFILICSISWLKLFISSLSYGGSYAMLRISASKQGKWMSKLLAYGFHIKSTDELRIMFDEMVEEFANIYVITYNALCARCFYVFMGNTLPNGESYMTASPDVIMGSHHHKILVAMGIVGLFTYVLGVPLILAAILFRAKQKDQLAKVSFLRRYGFLYRRYESNYFWWELVLLARRFLLTAVLVFLQDFGIAQAAVGSIIIALCIAAQYYAQPFRDEHIDRLDSFACMINLLYIVTGIVQTYGHIQTGEIYGGLLMFGIVAILAYAIYLLLIEVGDKVAVSRSYKVLTERVMNTLLNEPVPDDGETKEQAKQRIRVILGASDLVFRLIDTNMNQEITAVELKKCFHQITGEPSDELTDEQAQNLTDIMDETGSGAVNSYEFLAHIARELLARNAPLEHGTGIRRIMASHGMSDRIMTNAVSAFVKRAESNIGNQNGSFAKAMTSSNLGESFLDIDTFISTAAQAGFEKRCDQNARIAANNILHELPFTLNALGLLAWLEAGTDHNQIMTLLRLETFLQNAVSDTSELSEYRHTPRAETYRHIVHKFPFIVGYITEPSVSSVEVICLNKFFEMATSLYTRNNDWTSDRAQTIDELDYASILHWSLDMQNDDMRLQLGKLMEEIAEAKNRRVSDNPLLSLIGTFFPSMGDVFMKQKSKRLREQSLKKEKSLAAEKKIEMESFQVSMGENADSEIVSVSTHRQKRNERLASKSSFRYRMNR